MASKKLTSRKVDTLGPGRYNDGHGLYLIVAETGTRKWQARYTFNGKRAWMGLGRAKGGNLAAAREANERWQEIAKQGVDPKAVRDAEKSAAKLAEKVHTFASVAAEFIRTKRHEWRNPKHRLQWTATLKTYVRPTIGAKPVDQITREDVLTILKPIWRTKTETAKRVQGRMENILDFAAVKGYRTGDNPARWRGHLSMLLASPRKTRVVRNHPAMPYYLVPAFMSELRNNDCPSSRALQLLILTATRTNELLKAQWVEIDLAAKTWTIPADRMKANREHRVPLSESAIHILNGIPKVEGNPHLFPGARRARPMSNMAMLQMMRSMGYGVKGNRGDYVPHGFRSSFRDWSSEVSNFPRDVCEMALAHVIPNKAEAAYRRGDLFEKRRQLMRDWSAFLDKPSASVISIDGVAK